MTDKKPNQCHYRNPTGKFARFNLPLHAETIDNEAFGITPVKINESLASKRLSLSELEKHLNS